MMEVLNTLTTSNMRYKEIENALALKTILEAGGTLRHYAFQDIDFEPFIDAALGCCFEDCIFLGGKGVESKASLAHMRVTRSSVSDRLMMLWV